MNLESLSPLEDLQKRTGAGSELSKLQQGNVSVISFDSVQTTERLLDKLDLNEEEEMLLQRALEENKAKEKEEELVFLSKQKPAVCVPATGFPSLRHSSGNSNSSHRRMFSTGSVRIVSNDAKTVASRALIMDANFTDQRYSYIAVEEPRTSSESLQRQGNISVTSDQQSDRLFSGHTRNESSSTLTSADDVNTGFADRPLNIEKYRFKKYEPARYNVTPPITESLYTHYTKHDVSTPVSTPVHTPKTSVSSIGLTHPTTQSSSESDQSAGIPLVQTPNQSSGSHLFGAFPFDVSTPPSNSFKKEHRAKKSSFSLRRLFRSPKVSHVEDTPSPENKVKKTIGATTSTTSAPSTPMTNFKFPYRGDHELQQYEEIEEETKFVPLLRNSKTELNNVPFGGMSRERGKMSYENSNYQNRIADSHAPLSKQSSAPSPVIKPQHTYKMLLDPRPNIVSSPAATGVKPSLEASAYSSNLTKSELDLLLEHKSSNESQNSEKSFQRNNSMKRRIVAKKRIQIAIDLRNKGKLKESTAHLKEACKLGDRTAFLLYGLALRHGSGTKVDMLESFNWIRGATDIKDFKRTVLHSDIDPFHLTEDIRSPDNDASAPALYECGIAYLKGYGVQVSESRGLKCLEYAASLGHVDSMCLCGTIWSKSTQTRKKDSRKAAKWFRLAKDYGADLIGADWIYKRDYL